MTPLKLKRKAPHLESTLARTVPFESALTLRDIIPSFTFTSQIVAPKITRKEEKQKRVSPTTFQNTTDMEERVYQLIIEDSEKSEMGSRNGFRNKCYQDYATRLKLVRGCNWPIPERVVEFYRTAEEEEGAAPSFVQGCLAQTAIYYYAIENRVFFYDFGKAVESTLPIEQCFLNQFQFEFRVFELKEVTWSAPFFSELKQKNVVLVSSPWRIDFLVLEVPERAHTSHQHSKRWTKITMLNYYFVIGCKRAEFLTEGNRQMFYLDEKGSVNRLWFERTSFLGKMLRGETYNVAREKTSKSMSSNFFYLSRKATLLDKLRHYNKVICSEFKNLLVSRAENHGLVYDKERHLLFSLVERRSRGSLTEESIEYSYSKMVSCWKVVNNRLELQCEVSQLELFTAPQNQQILSYNIAKNNKIAKICPVDQAFYPDSCLMLLLQNAIRIYLKIKNNGFQIASFEYPPSLEASRQRPRVRKCLEYTKPMQLVHTYSEGSANILTVRDQAEQHTFMLWRDSQVREEQNCAYLNWGQSIHHGPGGNVPQQSFLFSSSLGLSSKKLHVISQDSNNQRQLLLKLQNAKSLHTLARDLFVEIPLFIHTTEHYLEYFFVSRPIDLLYMAISADIYDQKVLAKIFPELERRDLQFLLIQLLCDEEGLYLKDLALIQCFSSYLKSCWEAGVFRPFQQHRIEFFKNEPSAVGSRRSGREFITPRLADRSSITSDKESKICQLILDLCLDPDNKNNQQGFAERYHKQVTGTTSCILQYLSRVLRFIWMQQVYQISPKAAHLISLIEPLIRITDAIFDAEYLTRAKLDIQSNRHTIFETVVGVQELIQKKKQGEEGHRASFQGIFAKIQKLKYFISKIMQLLLLSTQMPLKVKKTFSGCLATEPQCLQQHIFNYLVVNYSTPFKVLQHYRKAFPMFIGNNLERSLKIYNETRRLDSQSAYQTAKLHASLPDYLLAYLKNQKGLRSWELKDMRAAREPKIKVTGTFGSKEAIEELKSKLLQDQVNLQERKHLICIINSQMQLYLQTKRQIEDMFYRSTLREVRDISKVVSFQQMLLQEYLKEGSRDSWVVEHLDSSLLKVEGLHEIVQGVESNSIKIVFHYCFLKESQQKDNQRPERLFRGLFIEGFKYFSKEDGLLRKLGLLSSQQQNSWRHLQKELSFVVSKIKNEVNLSQLLETLQIALENPIDSQINQSPKDNLQSLCSFLTSKGSSSRPLAPWILTHPYPIVGIMLADAGIDPLSLREVYMKQLHHKLYSQSRMTEASLTILLHIWINLYCLLVQFKGKEIVELASKTKELVGRIKKCQLLGESEDIAARIQELTEIARLRSKQSQSD